MMIPAHDYDGLPFTYQGARPMSKSRPLTNPDELEANRLAQARNPDPVKPIDEPANPINHTESLPEPAARAPRTRRGPNKELQFMAKMDQGLSEFDEAAQDRILDWINNRRCGGSGLSPQSKPAWQDRIPEFNRVPDRDVE